MDGGGTDLGPGQLLGQPVGSGAGPTEDNGRPCGPDRLGGEADPLATVHGPEEMGGRRDVRRLFTDLVSDRVDLVVAGQLGHVVVQRGGEEHRLTHSGRLVEDPAHGGHEAHVGQAVGLVYDDPVDVVQAQLSLFEQVLQAARAGHQNVNALAERF